MEEAQRAGLTSRYRSWDTEDLERAVYFEASGYDPEALALLRAELARRCAAPVGVPFSSASDPSRNASTEPSLQGVGGWLLLLIATLAINSLGLLYIGLALVTGRPEPSALLIALVEGGAGAFGLWVVWQLLRRSPRAPSLAIAWLALNVATSLAQAVFGALQGHRIDEPFLLSAALGAGIWCTYLSTSKRVKATYGESGD